VAGTVTNIGFLSALAADEDFSAGRVDTGLIARKIDTLTHAVVATPRDLAHAAVVWSGIVDAGRHRGFTLHDPLRWTVQIGEVDVSLTLRRADVIDCVVGDDMVVAENLGGVWRFNGLAARPSHAAGRVITLFGAQLLTLYLSDPADRASTLAAGDAVLSPMPGLLRDVSVKTGDVVKAGDPLAVLEAMKMEHVLRAPRDGKIASIAHMAGDQVQAGIVLIALEEAEGAS
jgi:3-methylcrotonyl-CoA carboxylase alpha subunit